MLVKVALRNIRRSVKDYAIYFVTLLMAVTLFYAFNSISEQHVMTEINESSHMDVSTFVNEMVSLFSYIIAFVLAFLVIYANSLLIRRRKREFGMYFMLGMKPIQVSRIIVYETVLVGVISLALGLGLGIVVSQLLSFATAAIFGIAMPDYQFSFSMDAFIMTLVCFCVIFLVVAVFNVFSIRRCKLIDLMNADSKSEKVAIRNPWLCLVLFIVSLGVLAAAYWQLQINGMTMLMDDNFKAATILMLVGTFLFFFSLAGFIIAVVTRMRGFYLKKLRPFTTRQVASKVNTSFVSMGVVSVLLFLAITTFATGMGLVQMFVGDVEEANPYDASVAVRPVENNPMLSKAEAKDMVNIPIEDVESYLQTHIKGWDQLVSESGEIVIYSLPSLTYNDILDSTGVTIESATAVNSKVDVIGISDFNRALELQNKPAIDLDDGHYLVTNNVDVTEELAKAMVNQGYLLDTGSETLIPETEVVDVQPNNMSMLSNALFLVVPDSVVDKLDPSTGISSSFINLKYRDGSNAEEVLPQLIEEANVAQINSTYTREEMIGQMQGMKLAITYLALYIGLVMLLAVAAVLAIQLISLTIDSLKRYRTLSRLGCDTRMLSRSLFAQITIYFLLPLLVGVCHSGWTISILSKTLFDAFHVDLLPTILMSAGLVVVIYGGYLLITYFVSRSMVVQGVRERA